MYKTNICTMRFARIILRNLTSKTEVTNPAISGVEKEVPVKEIQSPQPKINVDEKDIAHLGSFDQDWWDTNGSIKALHSMNMLRVPLVRDGLISTGLVRENLIGTSNVLEGLKLLEVGCGGGIMTEGLAKLKADIVAIDACDKLIKVAKDHAKENQEISDRIDYRLQTIEEHASGNQNKYDAVVASEVLEHIQDQRSFLKACVETLKPGGSIFLTTLNKTQLSWIFGIVAAEYILGLLPKNTHDWNQFISPVELEKILKEFNCQTVLVHGMNYEFWANRWTWCKYTHINYALHAIKDQDS